MARDVQAKAKLFFDVKGANQALQDFTSGMSKSLGGSGLTSSFKEGFSSGGLQGGFKNVGKGGFYGLSKALGAGRMAAGLMGGVGGIAGQAAGAFVQGGVNVAKEAGIMPALARLLSPRTIAIFERAAAAVEAKNSTKDAFGAAGAFASKESIRQFYAAELQMKELEKKAGSRVEETLAPDIASRAAKIATNDYPTAVWNDIKELLSGIHKQMRRF